MPLRMFIAVDLDGHILDGLVQAQKRLAVGGDKVRWTERPNLHVTMKFLGDVLDEDIHEVCQIVSAAAATVQPFDYDVRGLTVSPPHGPIRMVWGNVEDPTGRMNVLHEELDAALVELGLHEEHRLFRPHITVGRVKHVISPGAFRAAVRSFGDLDFGAAHCDELAVYNSVLTEDGAVYSAICHAPLGK